jgi:hypothetical protein
MKMAAVFAIARIYAECRDSGSNPVRRILENPMRKCALLLALAFVAAGPTTASAARAKPDPAIEAQKNSAAFFRDALMPWAVSTPKPAAKRAKKKKM